MRSIYLTTFITLLTGFQLLAQTYISEGEVSGTWKLIDSPFIIEGNLTIAPDERLTIQPGVEVYFSGPYSLEIQGRIDAAGTINDSILFSVLDTTNFYTPAYQGWFGLGFLGAGSNQAEYSNLEFCIIEFSAGSGVSCMDYSMLNINHSNIRFNKQKGINLLDNSHIQITSATIAHNLNGGLAINYSAPVVNDFFIHHNSNSGIYIYGSALSGGWPEFNNGTISNNQASFKGGGINLTADAKARFHEVGIFSNTAVKGGGIYSSFSYLELSKITLTDNTAQIGGGIYFGQIDWYDNSVINSISWNNFPDEIITESGQPDVSYSDIMGGYAGEGNIDENPWFSDSDNHDFKLSWSGFPNDVVSKSPCIDGGHPHAAYDPDGTRADMGAYYFHQTYSIPTYTKKNTDDVNVYPNPAKSNLHVYSETGFTHIRIIGLSGQVFKSIGQTGIQAGFDISELKSGVYIVRIEMADGTAMSKRLIKE